jgi:hypothetical protein
MRLALLAAIAALMGTVAARAAEVTRTFDITASDFTLTAGPGTDTPVDPVDIDFTLTFDPSVSVGPTTTGLKILSFNLPYTVSYAYSDETLVVALVPSLQPSGVSCALSGSGSFCLFMSDPAGDPAPPVTTQFNQVTADASLWQAQNLTTTFSPTLSVPEPSSWALLMMGFAALGFRLRARRRAGGSWMRLYYRRLQRLPAR